MNESLKSGEYIVYHAITERPMTVGQTIIFDSEHHNGVYNRIMTCKQILDGENPQGELADFIRSDILNWIGTTFRELAMERVRASEYPQYPSRLACLYTAKTFDEAKEWALFFKRVGRKTYGVAKIRVEGEVYEGLATNCFDGTTDMNANTERARHYWSNGESEDPPITEVLAAGRLTVLEITQI